MESISKDSLLKKIQWTLFLPLILIGLIEAGFLYLAYSSGRYRFFDLGLISDFLAAGMNGRGFFWSEALGHSHLKIHFSPTLILLSPVFYFFQSPFILILLGILFNLLSVGIWIKALAKSRSHFLPLSVFLGLNLFLTHIARSAHFEPIYLLLLALWTAAFLSKGKVSWLILLQILALGVRQDAGFFMGFFFMSLGFTFWRNPVLKRRAIISGISSVLYASVASFYILPKFGGDGNHHAGEFWAHLGNSWGEIFTHLFYSPSFLFQGFLKSGFWDLMLSFLFIPVLGPVWGGLAFLFAQLPGGIYYVSNFPEKSLLLEYNSTFLLPSAFFYFLFHYQTVLNWLAKHAVVLRKKSILKTALLVLILIEAIIWVRKSDFTRRYPAGAEFGCMRSLKHELYKLPKNFRVAIDSGHFVFLPNSMLKTRLERWKDADLIVLENANQYPHHENRDSTEVEPVREKLQASGSFVLKFEDTAFQYWVPLKNLR